MNWDGAQTVWDGRWYQHPLTGLACTRDECWDFVREVNLADIGEAQALVFNQLTGDFEYELA